MSETAKEPVECKACESTVQLTHAVGTLYLTCDCNGRGVKINDEIQENTLFDPFSGHWSLLDD